MKTAFAQIVDAMISALKATPPVSSLIDRGRSTVVPEQSLDAVSIQWEGAVPEGLAIAGAPTDWQTRISVEVLARSMKESGDLAVDPLLSAVTARLAQDTTLGGLVGDLSIVSLEAENTSEGKKTGWVRLTYVAQHRTYNGILN